MKKFIGLVLLAIGISTPCEVSRENIRCELHWNLCSGIDDRIEITKTVTTPDWIIEGMILEPMPNFAKVVSVTTDIESECQVATIQATVLSEEQRQKVLVKMLERGWEVTQDERYPSTGGDQ